MTKTFASARSIAWATVLIMLTGAVLVPLGRLAAEAVTGGWIPIQAALFGRGSGRAVLHTVIVAAGTTALALPLGTALALLTERSTVPARSLFRLAALLPLVVPAFVLGFSWGQAYGPSGLTDDLVGLPLPGLFGPVGIILVQAVNTAPLAYLIVAAGLATRSEPDLERAARVSGATGFDVLRSITLPLLREPLVAAGAVLFAASMESFAVPAVLGVPAGFSTMTTRMYQALQRSAEPAAFNQAIVLALTLVVLAMIVVAPVDRHLRPAAPATRTGGPPGATIRRPPHLGAALLAVVTTAYLVLAVGVPLVAMLLTSLTKAAGLAPIPANWSFVHFHDALRGPTIEALGRSAVLAAAAGVALLALGALVSWLERPRMGRSLGSLITLTFALPGSAVAIALLVTYGRWLGDTIAIIFIAYLAKFWTLAHRPLSGALERLPPDLQRASRASGADRLTAWRTVTMPMLAPAFIGAFSLVFVFALHELTMSSLLSAPDTQTLAVVTLNLQQLGDRGATAALALVVTVVTFAAAAPLLLTRRFVRRRMTPNAG